MPRIIVDCTHTFRTGAGTGIQRVVRHCADELLAIGAAAGHDVVPVAIDGAHLAALPVEHGRVAFPRAATAREAITGIAKPRTLEACQRWGLRANALLRSSRLADWLEGGPNADGLERLLREPPATPPTVRAVELARDDILVCLDSSWVYDIRTALEAAGRAGATRIAVLCDVLPLSHPEWFTQGTRRYFRGWLETLLPRLEAVIGISKATIDELRDLIAHRRLAAGALPECAWVHLGADIGEADESEVRPPLRAALADANAPAFLTVGTLEPRKNVDFALDLFDELAARGARFQWHIAGSAGWLADHTVKRIRNHPQYGRALHWWTDLRDGELTWCYEHAAALVAVSKAEGFGLPLVEARLHRLPVFASDIPVFREVLGAEGRYLPLSSAKLAATALEDFLRGALPMPARHTPTRVARSWRESAEELLATALRVHEARRGAA